MQSEKVRIEIDGKVAVATIDNPPANALSPELRDEFMGKLRELSENDQVWSVILTGAGEKFFMAGADIPGLAKLDPESALDRVRSTRRFFSALAGFEKPVIAAINGLCLGGGLELALVCDIRMAADHVKLGLPEVNLGLIPGAGGTQRLPRVIGPGWSRKSFLSRLFGRMLWNLHKGLTAKDLWPFGRPRGFLQEASSRCSKQDSIWRMRPFPNSAEPGTRTKA